MQSLEADPRHLDHLQRYGPDPAGFVNDQSRLTSQPLVFKSGEVGDAFVVRYRYTLELEARRTKDNVRWCFTMLMYYDLVRLIRPQSTGRVGQLMFNDISDFLRPLTKTPWLEEQHAFEQLNEWSRCGRKLNVLCRIFGEGCLFFLAERLSRDL